MLVYLVTLVDINVDCWYCGSQETVIGVYLDRAAAEDAARRADPCGMQEVWITSWDTAAQTRVEYQIGRQQDDTVHPDGVV